MAERGEVLVLGAGIVGVCAAIHLQRRGFSVTLIDKGEAGDETSYGNAGAIEGGSYTPIAFPRDPREILALAFKRRAAMNYHAGFLPKVAGWLYRLFKHSSREALFANSDLFRPILSHAIEEHEKLAADANASSLLTKPGWMVLYPTIESYETDTLDREIAARQGIFPKVLDVADALELEPHLKPNFAKALLWPEVAHTANPGALTKAYAKLFEAEGGVFLHENITGLERDEDGWRVSTSQNVHTAAQVVMALGPWSMDLIRPLGLDFPFAVKRGYHQHYKPSGNAVLSRPVLDLASGFVLAPMEQGVRITTGIEFADRDAEKTPVQLEKVLPMAKALFPLEDAVEDEPWMGRRPSFPDSRPIVAPAPGHDGLWLDFGHAHLGLTLGPASARLLADLMCGDTPYIDPAPFAATRF